MPVPATPIVSGVYKITNTANGKCYIGVSKNVNMRLETHKRWLKYNCHPNKHLQNSYNKHGENYFKFEVLEYCSIEELDEKEKYYIDYYDSLQHGFNNRHGGYDNFEWPEEVRRKISESNKGKVITLEHREKIRKKLKGFKHSEETRKKLSELRKGKNNVNYGGLSPQHIENMRRALTGRKQSKEHVENMIKARFPGKYFTFDEKLKMYELNKKDKLTRIQIAEMYGLNRQTVGKYIKEVEIYLKKQ
jgi:group I intron endonuclease